MYLTLLHLITMLTPFSLLSWFRTYFFLLVPQKDFGVVARHDIPALENSRLFAMYVSVIGMKMFIVRSDLLEVVHEFGEMAITL